MLLNVLRFLSGKDENCSPVNDIKQVESLKLLGISFQNNSTFAVHIKNKLLEANKCLFVIRSLKKEGYCQDDIDHLFNVIVLSLLTGLVFTLFLNLSSLLFRNFFAVVITSESKFPIL